MRAMMVARLLLIFALSWCSCTTMATTVIANDWVETDNDKHERIDIGGSSESINNHRRHIRSSLSASVSIDLQQEPTQPEHETKKFTDIKQAQENFLQAMLMNQGCPPTSSCGDVCYVLTISAASDLHSVASGTNDEPSHHWNEPGSFWNAGVCNSKAQCVSVNPFDRHHTYNDLASKLAEVERECERSVGMASMFLLAKAMDPHARSCDTAHHTT